MPSDAVLDELVEWAQGRPNWQRDAFRRLVVHGTLDTSDTDELLRICLDAHGAGDGTAPEPIPLSGEHLPSAPPGAGAVVLRSITEVRNVNALASEAQMLLEPTVLTIVYG